MPSTECGVCRGSASCTRSTGARILCSMCDRYFHATCVNMSSSDANYLSDSGTAWKCSDCLKGINTDRENTSLVDKGAEQELSSSQEPLTVEHFRSLMAAIRDIKASNEATNKIVRKEMQALRGRVDSCFDQLSALNSTVARVSGALESCQGSIGSLEQRSADLGRELQCVKQQMSDLKLAGNDDSSSPLGSVDKILSELNERKRRENNVILFNVVESKAVSSDVRRREDLDAVVVCIRSVCDSIDCESLVISRLGKYQRDKVRPIKVVFPSASEARLVLKNKKKCTSGIKICSDKTPSQRDYLKQLQNELKNLCESGVSNKTIRYVDNVPKIVNKQSKN